MDDGMKNSGLQNTLLNYVIMFFYFCDPRSKGLYRLR